MDNFDNDFNNYDGQPNHEINSRYGKSSAYHDHKRSKRDDTEFATDFLTNDATDGNATSGALIAGISGLAASVAALFTYSFVLGIIGIALGCFAVAKGNKIIGFMAIGIGFLAAVTPLFYTGPFMSLF